MKTIWKHPLEIVDTQEIALPRRSEIVHVDIQNNRPCLWVLQDISLPLEVITIDIFRTGQNIDDGIQRKHLGTCLGATLVYHVFQRYIEFKAIGSQSWVGMQFSRSVALIEALIDLKDYKDKNGKDEYYQTEQPKLWEKAKQLIEDVRSKFPPSESSGMN